MFQEKNKKEQKRKNIFIFKFCKNFFLSQLSVEFLLVVHKRNSTGVRSLFCLSYNWKNSSEKFEAKRKIIRKNFLKCKTWNTFLSWLILLNTWKLNSIFTDRELLSFFFFFLATYFQSFCMLFLKNNSEKTVLEKVSKFEKE